MYKVGLVLPYSFLRIAECDTEQQCLGVIVLSKIADDEAGEVNDYVYEELSDEGDEW